MIYLKISIVHRVVSYILYLIHYTNCAFYAPTIIIYYIIHAILYKRHAYCRQLIIYELLLFSYYCNLYYKWFMSMELTARGTRHALYLTYILNRSLDVS